MALIADNSTPLFGEGAASTLRLLGYAALAVALMVADRRGDYLQRLHDAAGLLVEPVYRLVGLPGALARQAGEAFADRRRLIEENQRLSQELLLAQTRLRRGEAVREQNLRLQELLAVQKTLGLSVQLAHVIDVDLGPFRRHYLMLDVGSANGVAVGQPVIDAHGVIGQIVQVSAHGATVMMITDAAHAIPVRIERTGLRTIARGSQKGELDALDLPMIPVSADVKPGDQLVTSGLGGRFPADFPVGTIRSVAPDASGMFAVAKVAPAAALDRSAEVLVLHELADPVGPPAPAGQVGPPVSLKGSGEDAPAPETGKP